jgi:hypothetical protein
MKKTKTNSKFSKFNFLFLLLLLYFLQPYYRFFVFTLGSSLFYRLLLFVVFTSILFCCTLIVELFGCSSFTRILFFSKLDLSITCCADLHGFFLKKVDGLK